MPAPAKAPAITSVGKCLPARTRSTDTKVVKLAARASVTQPRAGLFERANAKYVAVPPSAPTIDAWPEKNDSALSVLEFATPGLASASMYAWGRGRRTAILTTLVSARVSEA